MLIIKRTNQFAEWLHRLKSPSDRGAILMRLLRVQHGLFGDMRSIGEDIHELRLHIGPGYRLYIAREGADIYVLLCAGIKDTQKHDIELARTIWRDLKRERHA
ncbi:type II toxin-antitoxin system RelE/ParE family toxin [Pigmentiphaga sp. GD03639]|uniref:type II toxin-antitoxin system RelE/ParE family toxin n=1 Tax=Pigmentiphaga sp. GD03639 TaxID=2975354 RepID=UPI002446FA69|nr:type II toxin-antitoxin system RelE/ParE family toxin [Pigmentiphaga sp. GD03639]MDH2236588.1 type II toxin-antitoxin system RelE/ParE family toxin [Pigmentiphaga sp. GD03639]